MMDRQQIIGEIRDNFLQFLRRFFDVQLVGAEPYVLEYIQGASLGMSDQELLTSFSDWIDVFDGYITYLEEKAESLH